MRRGAALAALLLCSTASGAWAQSAVLQAGGGIKGHIPFYVDPKHVLDGGGATNGAIGTRPGGLGLQGPGNLLGLYDAPDTGPYHSLTLGFDSSGNGVLSLDAVGGAAQTNLLFLVNGVPLIGNFTVFGSQAAGAVVMTDPKTSPSGGLLSAPAVGIWEPQVHQSFRGGTQFGHYLAWRDQNLWLNADSNWTLSNDLSLYIAALGSHAGSLPHTGEQVGIRFPFGGTNYDVLYTLKNTDTTDQAVMLGVCLAVAANSAVIAQYRAAHDASGWGHEPTETGCTNQVAAGNFRFDFPWNADGLLPTALNSANYTVTVVSAYDNASRPQLDANPVSLLTRYVPGYTPAFPAMGPYIAFQGQTGPASGYQQLGFIQTVYTNNIGDPVTAAVQFGGMNGVELGIGSGVYVKNNGADCLGDKGAGSLSSCKFNATEYYLDSLATPVLALDGSGNPEVLAPAGKHLILGGQGFGAILDITAGAMTTGFPIVFAYLGAINAGPSIGGTVNQMAIVGGPGGVAFYKQTGLSTTFGVDDTGAVTIGAGVTAHALAATTSAGGKNALCIDGTTGEVYQSNSATCGP